LPAPKPGHPCDFDPAETHLASGGLRAFEQHDTVAAGRCQRAQFDPLRTVSPHRDDLHRIIVHLHIKKILVLCVVKLQRQLSPFKIQADPAALPDHHWNGRLGKIEASFVIKPRISRGDELHRWIFQIW
jgi:hypothetical protein